MDYKHRIQIYVRKSDRELAKQIEPFGFSKFVSDMLNSKSLHDWLRTEKEKLNE